MLNKLVAIFFCFLLTSCGTFNVHVETAPQATAEVQGAMPSPDNNIPLTQAWATTFAAATAYPGDPAGQSHILTQVAATLMPEYRISDTPSPAPSFGAIIRFSEGVGKPKSRSFAPKTRQVFAAWDYANMHEGLTVRREWYLNGQLWLSREEPWDFAKYGANGTITDVSVYDNDAGLPSGAYQLRLFINGQPQFVQEQASEQIAFAIQDVIPPILVSIRMSDTIHGWGIEQSGKVLRTTNGGSIWQDRTPPWGSFDQHSFFALNSEAAWAVPGNNIIWRTQDGGQTWKSSQPIALPAEGQYQVLSLQFPDAMNGWVALLAQNSSPNNAHTFLFRTVDGGENWSQVTELENPELASYLPDTRTRMLFFDGQSGWIGGWWGKDNPSRWVGLKTSDGGNSWKAEALPPIASLLAGKPTTCDGWSISDMPAGSMAVEMNCSQKNHLFHKLYYLSGSGSHTWRSWDLSGAFIGIDFLDNRKGWMMTTGPAGRLNEIYKTVNGGATWIKINQASWKTAQFDFVSDLVAWAIVGNGKTLALIHSVDGGITWQEIKPVVENK